jgi:nucleoside-diphosphate-sugar epimerase
MNILVTGGNGYIAKSLHKKLSPVYNIASITRNDFDLADYTQTLTWFEDKYFDVVIHTAISGGSRLETDDANVIDNNLKMYYNLLRNSAHFNKFINIGSGAELYNSTSPYGLSKRVIRDSILDKPNYYNLRVFGLFDEHELDQRFIKSNVLRYINKMPMSIHQNKHMDFFYMEDFVRVVQWYLTNNDVHKEFDCVYKKKYSLLDIAQIINRQSDYTVDIHQEVLKLSDNYIGTAQDIPIQYIGLPEAIHRVYTNLL